MPLTRSSDAEKWSTQRMIDTTFPKFSFRYLATTYHKCTTHTHSTHETIYINGLNPTQRSLPITPRPPYSHFAHHVRGASRCSVPQFNPLSFPILADRAKLCTFCSIEPFLQVLSLPTLPFLPIPSYCSRRIANIHHCKQILIGDDQRTERVSSMHLRDNVFRRRTRTGTSSAEKVEKSCRQQLNHRTNLDTPKTPQSCSFRASGMT